MLIFIEIHAIRAAHPREPRTTPNMVCQDHAGLGGVGCGSRVVVVVVVVVVEEVVVLVEQ